MQVWWTIIHLIICEDLWAQNEDVAVETFFLQQSISCNLCDVLDADERNSAVLSEVAEIATTLDRGSVVIDKVFCDKRRKS